MARSAMPTRPKRGPRCRAGSDLSNMDDEMMEIPGDVEAILLRQDEALSLLSRLRESEPYRKPRLDTQGKKRREFRRWPIPEGVGIELHDGDNWRKMDCNDLGIGGARVIWPADLEAPLPARLTTPSAPAALVLADIMWRDAKSELVGLRFEFQDEDERETWSGGLIDALLARHAVV